MRHSHSPARALATGMLVCVTALTSAVATGAGEADGATVSASPSRLAQAAYARLSARQRVGQLFLVGVTSTGPTSTELRRLADSSAGNVFLRGHNTVGQAATRRITDRLAKKATVAGVHPFVAADQEGGLVQSLQGPGFSRMPTALVQGSLTMPVLRSRVQGWGRELRRAGVNLDLAPVADTVPASVGRRNQPIGLHDREFAHQVPRVVGHVGAFVRGMNDARVATAVKHFPGLGRATGNTDDRAGVTDPTGPHSSYLLPFGAGIDAGAELVMVSSARYPKIDPVHRACYSRAVVGLLRGRLHFKGIVVSDSFASAALADLSPGTRAVRFFAAGGGLLLDTNAADLHPMTAAVLARTRTDRAFAAKIRTDVLAVLTAKARHGLLSA